MSPDAVVLTGWAALGAWGTSTSRLREALSTGEALTSPVERSGLHRPGSAERAALVPPIDAAAWIGAAAARRASPPSRWALVAAHLALEQAGLGLASPCGEGTGVVLSSAFGTSSCTESLVRQVLAEGGEAAQPFLFTECVANAPAAQVAIALGADGSNATITQREAGPLLALGRAAAAIRDGRLARAVAGAVGEMTPAVHALLDRFGALARPARGRPEAARPLDRRRDGFLAGEGATVALLETAGAACRRGAMPLARVRTAGSAFDPTARPSHWGHGAQGLGRALRSQLQRAGIPLERIDLVIAGACGARAGDRLEAQALVAAWEDRPLPPVVTPLAVTGQYGGGQLPGALAAITGAPIARPRSFIEADPDLGVAPQDVSPLTPGALALVTGFAAGGAAAWVVLERV